MTKMLVRSRLDGSGLNTEGVSISKMRSVLVVEDDELMRLRLRTLLEPVGYCVTCVSSMQAARTAMVAVCFQVMIIDRILPDGDGIALCAHAKARGKQTPVFLVMLSARDSALDVAAGRRAGANVYLSKCTSDAELLAYIDAATAAAQFAAKSRFAPDAVGETPTQPGGRLQPANVE